MALVTPRSLVRTLVAGFLSVLLIVPIATSASASNTTFSDVPKSQQFYTQITWLASDGITTGFADGTFRPKESVTREAFAAFLYRMAGNPKVSMPGSSPFKDVRKSDQFYKQIIWAKNTNITTGYADNTFQPKTKISREAIAAFLYRFQGKPPVSLPSSSPFKDLSTRAQFFKEIVWLRASDVTTGYADGTFKPKNNTSREATAAFLYRVNRLSNTPPQTRVPESFTVKGAGWGHGVGMSQFGAWGMAKDGSSETEILKHYFQGTSVKSANANKLIKVEVFGSGSDNRNSVDVVVRSPGSDTTDDGRWRMRFYDYGPGDSAVLNTTWAGKNNEDLKVTRDGNEVLVERENGDTATASKDVSLQWEATSYYDSGSDEDAYVELQNRPGGNRVTHGQYRHGKLLISVPSSSYPRLIIANYLKLNTEYLYGIAEMPSSWDSEALQAQAIAARGFALNAVNTYSSTCNCNLYDDTRSQNFSGWKKESEGAGAMYGKRWVAAVDATNSPDNTEGKVLMFGSSIAKLYYFSSSGGQTENSKDIWGGNYSYLTSVPDPWSLSSRNPNDSWTYTLSQAKARSIFGLSDVMSIKVTSRTAGGSDAAAKVVTATSSSGDKSSISGSERIRSTIVAGKSPWLWSFKANY